MSRVSDNWFKDHGDESYEEQEKAEAVGGKRNDSKRILLVDDSPFFRNMLIPLLRVAGYDVTSCENAIEAFDLCEQGRRFDVIVSDIEMPEMSGFEFAEKVKSSSIWDKTPLEALSSHATPQDVDRGYEAGFNKYVAKFDRDSLLDTIKQTLVEADSYEGSSKKQGDKA